MVYLSYKGKKIKIYKVSKPKVKEKDILEK